MSALFSLFIRLDVFFAAIATASSKNVTDFRVGHVADQQELDCLTFSAYRYRENANDQLSGDGCCGQVQLPTLKDYLDALKRWQCPQFHDQCTERPQATNEVSKLLYDYYCDYQIFLNTCFPVSHDSSLKLAENMSTSTEDSSRTTSGEVTPKTHEPVTKSKLLSSDVIEHGKEWEALFSQQANSSYTYSTDDIMVNCMKVALLVGDVKYLEENYVVLRISETEQCEYELKTLRENVITYWSCLEDLRYKTAIVVMTSIATAISVCILVVNIYIIGIYSQTASLMNSQGVYKLSLGIADFLVGLISMVTIVYTIRLLFQTRLENNPSLVIGAYTTIQALPDEDKMLVINKSVQHIFAVNSETFAFILSTSTVTSYSVSVLTLICAGIDRLQAVGQPLKYNKDKAKRLAKICCVVVWIFGILFAGVAIILSAGVLIIPPFIVILIGPASAILYNVFFGLLLALMWVVSILLLCFVWKHRRAMRCIGLREHSRPNSAKEVHLALTLSIMVGVFTISTLPIIIVLIIGLSSPFISTVTLTIAVVLLTCNSLWNFFIYSARNPDFRNAFKSIHREFATKLSQCCK